MVFLAPFVRQLCNMPLLMVENGFSLKSGRAWAFIRKISNSAYRLLQPALGHLGVGSRGFPKVFSLGALDTNCRSRRSKYHSSATVLLRSQPCSPLWIGGIAGGHPSGGLPRPASVFFDIFANSHRTSYALRWNLALSGLSGFVSHMFPMWPIPELRHTEVSH